MTALSIGEVTEYIKRLFADNQTLRNITVRGEVSNFKRYPTGHCYFTLKDNSAALKCVMFKSRAASLRFEPNNGMAVFAVGRIGVFERDGVYQLYVDSLQPDGVGALALAFEELKNRLTSEGLFDESRKKPLPFFPRVIGVVTSRAGAVLRDINRVSKQRSTVVSLALYPVKVQGEDAARQIAAAIEFFNDEYPVDVLIVGRGGGSMEDLWAFNEEPVVRAIAASNIPVISAVGHETDFTLADFAADVRAATPSQAAELAVPNVAELLRRVDGLHVRLFDIAQNCMKLKKARFERLTASTVLSRPQELLNSKRQRLDNALERLEERGIGAFTAKRHGLELLLERLSAINPASVMKRGFAAVEKDGKALNTVDGVERGDVFLVTMVDGGIEGEVRRCWRQ